MKIPPEILLENSGMFRISKCNLLEHLTVHPSIFLSPVHHGQIIDALETARVLRFYDEQQLNFMSASCIGTIHDGDSSFDSLCPGACFSSASANVFFGRDFE